MGLTVAEVFQQLEDHRYELRVWTFIEDQLCRYQDQDKHRQADAGMRVKGCSQAYVPAEVFEQIIETIRAEKMEPITQHIDSIEGLSVEDQDDNQEGQEGHQKVRKKVRKKTRRKVPSKGRRDFSRFLGKLDERVMDLASAKIGLWQNQQNMDTAVKSLAEAQRSLDHQVAVLTRITITNLNKMRALNGLDFITEGELESFFVDWNEFIKRSDRNAQMPHWILGKPLEDLPPPPEPEDKEEETTPTAPEGAEEVPTIFGGDYAESENGNETPSESSGPEDKGCDEEDAVSLLP